jgi:hypothetical protein
MLFICYLRNDVVYVPTMGRRKSEPVYSTIEPVSVVPLSNPEGVQRALLETIARRNVVIPDPDQKALRQPPLILRYAGVKSWSTFFRGASMWGIREGDGAYAVLFYRKDPKGYYQQDLAQEIKFPLGTAVDDVVHRMIAILQDAARRPST